MQPLVAITGTEVTSQRHPWAPAVYGQFRTYIDSVVQAGGVPVLVPLIDDEEILRQLYKRCDGLLLTGGNDVDPNSYKTPRSEHVREISPRRDKQEMQLLQWALKDGKSVLGICRGMQLINVALGGSLYADIGALLPTAHNHEVCVERQEFEHLAHTLKIEPGSQLSKILGANKIGTNALHHQAIRELGAGLVPTAYSEDGIIEAIELPSKQFVIGVQSHPEALGQAAEPRWANLFIAFIEHALADGGSGSKR